MQWLLPRQVFRLALWKAQGLFPKVTQQQRRRLELAQELWAVALEPLVAPVVQLALRESGSVPLVRPGLVPLGQLGLVRRLQLVLEPAP